MGLDNRDYGRAGYEGSYGGGYGGGGGMGMLRPPGFRAWSVVIWLLAINAGIFLVDVVLERAMGEVRIEVKAPVVEPVAIDGEVVAERVVASGTFAGVKPIESLGFFSVATTFQGFQLWRLVSFQFMHAGLWHLVGNALGLFFLGPMIEQWLGSRRFLAFFLLCGVAGALTYTVLALTGVLVSSPAVPLVGASGGVFGILAAAALIAPNTKILLFFVLPVPLKAVIWAALFIAVVFVVGGGENAGGHAAHLGGAALGFLLIRQAGWLNWADCVSVPDVKGAIDERRRESAARREAATEEEVDRILAKVREEGMHSLTDKEKRALADATERQRR
ncbi:MAG: rhomboid family intramembrane serine protease, partial [Planctomycetota bacterium]